MPAKPRKVGRPQQPETTVVRVPTDKVAIVEKIIGREIAGNQTPHYMVRVPTAKVATIRKQLKKG